MKKRTLVRVHLGALGMVAAITLPAFGANDIYTEAVSDYGDHTLNAIASCDGFRNAILQSTSWDASDRWLDADVIDVDYVDSNINSSGEDLSWFDRSGNANGVAMFCGHGTANNGIPAQFGHPWEYCMDNIANPTDHCDSPPSGYAFPAACRFQPPPIQPNGRGICTYQTARKIITYGAWEVFDNAVNYSNGLVRFGESSNAGSWDGASTNGGNNVVVLDLSNGVLPGLEWPNSVNSFSGVHMLLTTMPVTGDTNSSSARGGAFGNQGRLTPSEDVGESWADVIGTLSSGDGSICGYKPGDGGRGYNGCGCNNTITVGANQTEALDHQGESWTQSRSDTRDGKGASAMWVYWRCNYDEASYPMFRG